MLTYQTLYSSVCRPKLYINVSVVSPVALASEKTPGLFQDLIITCLLGQSKCKGGGVAVNHSCSIDELRAYR